MNLLERVLTLLRANLNTVIEKSDDPEQVLRQLQLDMRNQLVQVKTQVATAIAEEHKIQKRCDLKKQEADSWLRKAEQALQQENDDLARAALSHQNDALRQLQRYQQQKQEQDQLVSMLRSALRQLETKITEVETTLDLLASRRRNALIQQRIYDALNKSGEGKENERTGQVKDAVLEAEARARALAELHRQDLDTQLETLSAEQMVEQQLQNLKARKRGASSPPQLPAGDGKSSPLLDPKPRSGEPSRQKRNEKQQRGSAPPNDSTLSDSDLEHLRKLLKDK